jgi:signal transduction histidine kinase
MRSGISGAVDVHYGSYHANIINPAPRRTVAYAATRCARGRAMSNPACPWPATPAPIRGAKTPFPRCPLILVQCGLPYISGKPFDPKCTMLHDFIVTNRSIIIDRCRVMAAARSEPKTAGHDLAQGIPAFLDQLIGVLASEQQKLCCSTNGQQGADEKASTREIRETAMLQVHDLLEQGFTLEQVVRNYGDVCQAVTNQAFESGANIAVDHFRTLNRCLDNAIAGAVTQYTSHRGPDNGPGTETVNAWLGPLAHELRNHLHTATLVVAAIKAGKVGISGVTAAVLDRSLLGMRGLIDHALAEVRVNARMPPQREAIKLAQFLDNIKVSASFDALARGTPFTVAPVADDVSVYAEREMLAAAVGNLLQNAFKFTKHRTEVQLRAHVHEDRVLIEVEDRCGGLPDGVAETMFLPFAQSGDDRSGLGLGLDISRRSVEANGGVLTVQNVPGTGCIFTINLPRLAPSNSEIH